MQCARFKIQHLIVSFIENKYKIFPNSLIEFTNTFLQSVQKYLGTYLHNIEKLRGIKSKIKEVNISVIGMLT